MANQRQRDLYKEIEEKIEAFKRDYAQLRGKPKEELFPSKS